MRDEIDAKFQYTNHIEQNIRIAPKYNELNKVVFLSKIKFNVES